MEKRELISSTFLILFLAMLSSNINQPTITAKVVGLNPIPSGNLGGAIEDLEDGSDSETDSGQQTEEEQGTGEHSEYDPNYIPRFKLWYLEQYKQEEIEEEQEEIQQLEQKYSSLNPPEFIGSNCKDKDNDLYPAKFFACLNGPFDCNDKNPEVYPGALEICDGMDTNCDGIIEDDYEGSGCIPDFTTAHSPPVKDNRWLRFLQILKDIIKNPPPPLIDEVIFNRNTGELIIQGENFYKEEMKKGITTKLTIGSIENNIYQNAYSYTPSFLEENYMSISFQDFPEDIDIWVQIINVIDKRKVSTPGNIYKLRV